MYREVSDFCKTLTSESVFEGTCNCACITVSERFEDKIEPCHATDTEQVFATDPAYEHFRNTKKN